MNNGTIASSTPGRGYKFLIFILILIGIGAFLIFKNPLATHRGVNTLGIQVPDSPEAAKNFSLQDIHGHVIKLSDFRGKIVMLNFWATWCTPCRKEMPSMEKLYEKYRDKGLVILSVAAGEKVKDVVEFVKKFHITFPALVDTDLKVTDDYNVWALPTTYFINREGKVIGKVYGSRDWSTGAAKKYIENLLNS